MERCNGWRVRRIRHGAGPGCPQADVEYAPGAYRGVKRIKDLEQQIQEPKRANEIRNERRIFFGARQHNKESRSPTLTATPSWSNHTYCTASGRGAGDLDARITATTQSPSAPAYRDTVLGQRRLGQSH